jgi:hypothetical protein
MSVFDEFTSAYTRFRMAAEYNGHLWHCLLLRAQGTIALSPKHCHALLRELRSRLLAEANAECPITQLLDELVNNAHEFVPEKSGGRSYKVVDCPWSAKKPGSLGQKTAKTSSCSGPDASDFSRDSRAGFRAGLDALQDIVVLVDIVGIAREQARRYPWPRHAQPESAIDLDGIAWEALGEEDFLDGCLSPRLLSPMSLALLTLMSHHEDLSLIEQDDIIRITRDPMPAGGERTITLYGRIASIINAVWDKVHRKERRDRKLFNFHPSRLDSMATVDDPNDRDAKEAVEVALGRFSADQQAVLLFIVKRHYEEGANLKAAYEEAGKDFGLSTAQVKALWRKFKHRLLTEGES